MGSTFWSDVDRLTVPYHKILHRDHGTEVVTLDGLIQQLRSAVQVGMEVGRSSSAFGSRPTIDAGAQDLLLEVTGQAREALSAAIGRKAPVGMPESHIRKWAAVVNETTMVRVSEKAQYPDSLVDKWRQAGVAHSATYVQFVELPAWRMVRYWVDRIEGFFFPPETVEIKAACPVCEERWVHRVKEGETVQSPAMLFVRVDGDITEAKCVACGSRWNPSQFEWLARAVGATPVPEIAHAMSVVQEKMEER